MNLKEKWNGIGQRNTKKYSKNSKTRLQVNQYSFFQREMVNSE